MRAAFADQAYFTKGDEARSEQLDARRGTLWRVGYGAALRDTRQRRRAQALGARLTRYRGQQLRSRRFCVRVNDAPQRRRITMRYQREMQRAHQLQQRHDQRHKGAERAGSRGPVHPEEPDKYRKGGAVNRNFSVQRRDVTAKAPRSAGSALS